MKLWNPGQELVLTGMRWREWSALARQCFATSGRGSAPRYLRLTLQSALNEIIARQEEAAAPSPPATAPLFVLGCWRSGTTWLHRLLACDPARSSPTLLQTLNPHTFAFLQGQKGAPWARHLYGRWARFHWGRRLHRWQRPSDAMETGPEYPGEDEFAMLMLARSDLLQHLVGRDKATHWARYLALNLSAQEYEQWQRQWLWFLGKVAARNPQRPLLLKSPNHTARLHSLLKIWPDARFVHLHRHPYEVFQSLSAHLERVEQIGDRLEPRWRSSEESALELYNQLYGPYLARRGGLPRQQLVEVAYHELCVDPLGQLQRVYRQLELPGWNRAEPRLRALLHSQQGYRTTAHTQLSTQQRLKVASCWGEAFEAFGYRP